MIQECAILAGGCFWGMEDLICKLPGVVDTTVGYTGGTVKNPTYELVKSRNTGHAEAIEIMFDPAALSYRQLLEFFFQIHNPTTPNQQGNDVGSAYRSVIFYVNKEQKRTAHEVMRDIEKSRRWPGAVVTELVPASEFYKAEAYHQDYLERFPEGYTCHFIRPDWKLD